MKTKNSMLSLVVITVGLITALLIRTEEAYAQLPEYNMRAYYFYEVGNQIPLSDFNLGSDEMIKDSDGNGLGFSWEFKRGDKLRAELDLGYSRTIYKGEVEDGVNVTFEPQTGSGYEILSSSKNVVYDFNVEFDNPYLGLSFVLYYFRFGLGRIMQSSTGDIKLYASRIKIAEAKYEAKNQLYGQIGFDLNLDWLYVGGYIRAFDSPSLKITYCNEDALGALACQRIKGATGNRNLRSNTFGEGVIHLGVLF